MALLPVLSHGTFWLSGILTGPRRVFVPVGGRQLDLAGHDRTRPDRPGSRVWRADQRQIPGALRRSGRGERVAREHRPRRPLGGVFSRVRVGAAATRATVSGAVAAARTTGSGLPTTEALASERTARLIPITPSSSAPAMRAFQSKCRDMGRYRRR